MGSYAPSNAAVAGDDLLVLTREATDLECLVWDLKQSGWLLGENTSAATRSMFPLQVTNQRNRQNLLIADIGAAKQFLESVTPVHRLRSRL